ncbi:hypothetical protein EYR41_009928 [Orbilia oligospora]|uniref:Nucleoside phosphorylase domain-containing protein n=1 Tax=Orbilia oligospora TaxID=2813651 RepID=A0A8H2HGK2_ORBOL|nr:hypothetical protein EYR41_009928 [Orbilia oligospora]
MENSGVIIPYFVRILMFLASGPSLPLFGFSNTEDAEILCLATGWDHNQNLEFSSSIKEIDLGAAIDEFLHQFSRYKSERRKLTGVQNLDVYLGLYGNSRFGYNYSDEENALVPDLRKIGWSESGTTGNCCNLSQGDLYYEYDAELAFNSEMGKLSGTNFINIFGGLADDPLNYNSLWNIGPNSRNGEEQGQQQQDERQRPEVGLDSLEDRNRVAVSAEQKGQDYIEGQAIPKYESEDEDEGARGEGQGSFHPPPTLTDEHRQYGQQDNLEEQLSITIATTFTTTNASTTTTDPTTSDTNITTAGLDTDDVETVYSETSSFATSEKENYISELAAVLFHEIRELLRSDNSETTIWERIYTEKYSHGDAESVPNTQVVENTNMDLAAKMDLWHENSEYPPSHLQHGPLLEDQFEENTFRGDAEYENGGDKTQGMDKNKQGAEEKSEYGDGSDGGDLYDITEDEETKLGKPAIDRAMVYRDFILKTPAFEWLVGVLRREITLLTPAEPNYMEITKRSVSECLPSSHRISKDRSAEAFNTIFLTGWKPLTFVKEQEYELKPSEAIERAVTLTGSAEDAQALTCVEYLCHTWPSTGKYIIELVKDVIDESEILHICTLPDNTALIAYFRESSELVVEAVGTKDSVAEIGQQLAWLCTALSPSSLETGVVAFIPLIKNSQSPNSRERGTTTRPTDPRGLAHANSNLPTFSFRLHFNTEEREQNIIPPSGQCWHNMFRNPVVVKGYLIPWRLNLKTRLEIPLKMMAELARSHYIQAFDRHIFIKGFSTLLIPTKRDDNITTWHLLYNRHGNRISYLENTISHADGLNISELRTSRHILGWCSEAGYYAGAADADYKIRPSHLSRTYERCLLYRAHISKARDIRDGAPFALGRKDTPFHMSGKISERKIRHIHTKFVVLWDDQDKRGWLVNGTSALLHLLCRSLESDRTSDFGFRLCYKEENMQGAPVKYKGFSAIHMLLNEKNLKQHIYPEKDGYFCVQGRLEELYDTLDKALEHQDKIVEEENCLDIGEKRQLEGWDFNHLAAGQDNICSRVTETPKAGASWVDLSRSIRAVVLFGRGFGEIIKPLDPFFPCTRWAALPKREYYLAATVRDLTEIMNANSGQETNPIKLTDDIVCHSPDEPFGNANVKAKGIQLCHGGALISGNDQESKQYLEDLGHPEANAPLTSPESEALSNDVDSGLGTILSQSSFFDPRTKLGTGPSFTDSKSRSERRLTSAQTSDGIGIVQTSLVFKREDYNVGIVCALPKEHLAVRAIFDGKHQNLIYPPEDTNHYALGCIHNHNIVSACLPSGEYGTCAAADVLVHMKRSFPNLKICLLVGIGGGVPSEKNDIQLGDVVVSHPEGDSTGVIQYDLGKTLKKNEFVRKGFLQSPPRFIMTGISDLESDPDKARYPLQACLESIATRHPEYGYPGYQFDPLLAANAERNSSSSGDGHTEEGIPGKNAQVSKL